MATGNFRFSDGPLPVSINFASFFVSCSDVIVACDY
jgi:hypothetical protein